MLTAKTARTGRRARTPRRDPQQVRDGFATALETVAADQPARAALVGVHDGAVLTWRELAGRSAAIAAELEAQVSAAGSATAIVALVDNTPASIALLTGALRTVAPLIVLPADARPDVVEGVREALHRRGTIAVVASAKGSVVRDDANGGRRANTRVGVDASGAQVAGRPPAPGELLLSTGGTTGAPKLANATALRRSPVAVPFDGRLVSRLRWRPGQTQLVVAPTGHASSLLFVVEGLAAGNTLVLQRDVAVSVMADVIESHRVTWAHMTPFHMRWASRTFGARPGALATLRALVHTSAPCPHGTKRQWIDVLGPSAVFEMYGATEGIGTTVASGDEWLERPGTVGRGFFTKVRVVGDDGTPLLPRHEGIVQLKTAGRVPQIAYTADGFATVGDVGYLDEDAYLFLAPRRFDLILVAGANVYPSEVEAVLLEHCDVVDAAVVGVPDDRTGERVCAIVVGTRIETNDLLRHCRDRLARVKVPRRFVIADELPRNASGKLDRATVRALVQDGAVRQVT